MMRKIFLRPVTICMIVIVCLTYGVFVTTNMPLELLPDMTMPMLCVSCVYPGAGASSVKENVTDAIEENIKTISKIDSLDSYSLDNVSLVVISFDYGVSLEQKTKELEDILDGISLPDECNAPSVLKIDFNGSAIATVAVSSDDMFAAYADAQLLREKFLAIEDVGSVEIDGYTDKSIRITPINGLEITTLLLVQAVAYDNSLDIPIGSITEGSETVALRNDSSAATVNDLRSIPVELPLPKETVDTFLSLRDLLSYYESMNSSDLDELKAQLDAIDDTIDSFDRMKTDELTALIEQAEQIKQLIEFIEGHTTKELELIWDVLKYPIQSEAFHNMTEDELEDLSKELAEYGYNVDVVVLEWLQTKSVADEETGISPAEEMWSNIVTFRREHDKKKATTKEYATLLYDMGVVQKDNKKADNYVEEAELEFIVAIATDKDGIPLLRDIRKAKKSNSRVDDITYAKLISYADDSMSVETLEKVVWFVRNDSFEDIWSVLYETKLRNQSMIDFRDIDNKGRLYTEYGMHGQKLTAYSVYCLYNEAELGSLYNVSYSPTPELFSFILGIDEQALADNSNGSVTVKASLGDVANVALEKSADSFAMLNDSECVTLSVYGISEANTTAISEGVTEILDSVTKTISSTAILADDQSTFIKESVSTVLSSMLIGGALAVLVIFVFLRQVRVSLIIAITMPLSVICALIALDLIGTTLNMVSLGGLTVGIGMLVDNSIVVIDSITKERATGKSAIDSAVGGTRSVVGSLVASTLTSICVFFPILFTQGLTKEIFTDLAYAVMFSLVFSLVVALFVIPTLYCMLYKNKNDKAEKGDGFIMQKIATLYDKIIRFALSKRALVLVIALIVFVSSILLVVNAGIEFMPSVDKGIVKATMSFSPSETLASCEEKTKILYDRVKNEIIGIDYALMTVGKQGIAALSNSGSVEIYLGDGAEDTAIVVEKVRELSEGISGASTSVMQIDGIVATITSGMSGLSVRILGDDVDTLREISGKVQEKLADEETFKYVYDNLTDESVQYSISIDEARCSRLGVDYSALVTTLRAGISGYSVCAAEIDNERMEIIVSFDDNALSEYYGGFFDYTVGYDKNGKAISISDVSDVKKENTRSVIRTYNGVNQLDISAEIYGTDTGSALTIMQNAVEETLVDYDGYVYATSGVSSYLTTAFVGLVYALIISFFLLFAVMAGQFESLIYPFVVIFAIPLSFTGGFLALWISGATLNVVSFVGIIMLMGVVVNSAIIMIDKTMQLAKDGMPQYEAIVAGSKSRLRAIFMTTLTTVLALVPLALGIGDGAELMQPLGIVVIGGLTLGTLVTLVLVPIMYSIMRKVEIPKRANKTKKGTTVNNESACDWESS